MPHVLFVVKSRKVGIPDTHVIIGCGVPIALPTSDEMGGQMVMAPIAPVRYPVHFPENYEEMSGERPPMFDPVVDNEIGGWFFPFTLGWLFNDAVTALTDYITSHRVAAKSGKTAVTSNPVSGTKRRGKRGAIQASDGATQAASKPTVSGGDLNITHENGKLSILHAHEVGAVTGFSEVPSSDGVSCRQMPDGTTCCYKRIITPRGVPITVQSCSSPSDFSKVAGMGLAPNFSQKDLSDQVNEVAKNMGTGTLRMVDDPIGYIGNVLKEAGGILDDKKVQTAISFVGMIYPELGIAMKLINSSDKGDKAASSHMDTIEAHAKAGNPDAQAAHGLLHAARNELDRLDTIHDGKKKSYYDAALSGVGGDGADLVLTDEMGAIKIRAGQNPRQWRPGRISVEKAHAPFRAPVPKTPGQTPGQPPGQSVPVPHAPTPQQTHPTLPKRPGGIPGPMKSQTRMGATPDYVPNGQVWLSQASIPLTWGTIGDTRQKLKNWMDAVASGAGVMARAGIPMPDLGALQDPIILPDGTPLVGHLWFPKVDLRQVDAGQYKAFEYQISLDMNFYDFGGSRTFKYSSLGNHPDFGAWVMEYGKVRFRAGNGVLVPLQPGETSDAYPGRLPHIYRVPGVDDDGYSIVGCPVDFDWSKNSPCDNAYPWWYNWVRPDILPFAAVPADFWRADLQDISQSGFPFYLPGPPWIFNCIEFLDYLYTGAHGIPAMIDGNGFLDLKKLTDWFKAVGWWQGPKGEPRMSRVFAQQSGSRTFVVATIYDQAGVATSYRTPQVPPVDPSIPLADVSNQYQQTPPGYADPGQTPYPQAPPDQQQPDPGYYQQQPDPGYYQQPQPYPYPQQPDPGYAVPPPPGYYPPGYQQQPYPFYSPGYPGYDPNAYPYPPEGVPSFDFPDPSDTEVSDEN